MNLKKKTLISLIVLFIVIGFAAVSSTLVINGGIGIGEGNFDIKFTKAVVDGVDLSSSIITNEGKNIEFSTSVLKSVGDYSVLRFDVSNNSKNYDAEIQTNCVINGSFKEYYEVTYDYPSLVKALHTESGSIKVTLTRAMVEDINESIVCNLVVTAKDKTVESINEEVELVNNSIYSWETIALNPSNFDETIDLLEELNVTSLYQSIHTHSLPTEQLKNVVSSLNSVGIDTYSLEGRPEYYNNYEVLKEKVDLVIDYNNGALENEKIKGLVLDIEPYVIDGYDANILGVLADYSNTLEQIYTYAASANLRIVNVLPYWYNESYLEGDKFTTDEKVLIEGYLRKIFANSDRVSIMNYYKGAMLKNIQYELDLASDVGVEIESIAEFQRPNASIPTTISMWEEDRPFDILYGWWEEIKKSYTNARFSYHDLSTVLELKRDYKLTNFEFYDASGNNLTGVKKYIVYKDGKVNYASSESDLAIPHFRVEEFIVDNYEVINTKKEDLGDNKEKIIMTLEPNYTIEVYSKINSVNQGSGTLFMKNVLTGEETSYQVTENAYVVIKNIYAEKPYEFRFITADGEEYEVDYITARDDNKVSNIISNDAKQLYIPKNYKANHYLGPSIYFVKKT